ncbi:13235_t:CDS:2, partial [Acaulospora colombiana]
MSPTPQNSPESLPPTSPPYRFRANLSPLDRFIAIAAVSSGWGLLFGSYTGGKTAGLQHLAENAHKLPRTKSGWYHYHKHKNFRMIIGGLKSGIHLAGKTSLLCLCFSGTEAILDELRKENDIWNSCVAGLLSAGIISSFYRLPRQSAKYAYTIGLGFGLITGGMQDYLKLSQGQRIWYIDRLK